MRTLNKKLYLLKIFAISIILCGNTVKSQTSDTNNVLYVIPNIPTTTDTIYLVHEQGFGAHPVFRDSVSVNLYNSEIVMDVYYSEGLVHVIATHIDTLLIGSLPEQNYRLYLNSFTNFPEGSFITRVLEFSVSETNAITDGFHAREKISIYPNPARESVFIALNDDISIHEINLYNLNGKLLKTYLPSDTQLCLSGISEGMYFLYIQTNEIVLRKKIMIK